MTFALMAEQADANGFVVEASPKELDDLRTDVVVHQAIGWHDVRDWFATSVVPKPCP